MQPNIARFAAVSATFTSIPSAAHTIIPASSTADGSSSAISGPAACQNRASIRPAGTSTRQPVTTFSVGTCHSRANGTSASSPASRASASQYEASGIRVIASISRMTSGYDMIRRRCRFLSRPCSSAAATISSITPSPRWRSSSPSRTKSGSHPSARTLPSLPSHGRGGHHRAAEHRQLARRRRRRSPAVTVPPPRTCRSAARTTSVPAGVPSPGTPLSGLHQRRQADKKAQGLLGRAWTRHPNAYQEPSPQAKPAHHATRARQNHRSQPHENLTALKSVVLRHGRHPQLQSPLVELAPRLDHRELANQSERFLDPRTSDGGYMYITKSSSPAHSMAWARLSPSFCIVSGLSGLS